MRATNEELLAGHANWVAIFVRLEGKVAIITGGAGDIGSVTANLFASHGAHVILADLNSDKGEKVAQQIGQRSIFRLCDVAVEEDVAAVVEYAMEKFGKLDIMINNAGVASPLDSFETLDMDVYDRCTAVNVRGVILGIKHAARVMVPAKSGTILNTGSIASISTGGTIKLIYNINKMNIPGITKIAAYHLGKCGIRVNCISPVGIPTEMVVAWHKHFGQEVDMETIIQAFQRTSPLAGKMCTCNDIARGALFLCSDESGYVSGQNLVVDAGYSNIVDYDPMRIRSHSPTESSNSSCRSSSGDWGDIGELETSEKQSQNPPVTSKL